MPVEIFITILAYYFLCKTDLRGREVGIKNRNMKEKNNRCFYVLFLNFSIIYNANNKGIFANEPVRLYRFLVIEFRSQIEICTIFLKVFLIKFTIYVIKRLTKSI